MTRILVDPRVAFGRPYVEGSGVRSAVLRSRALAGETRKALAEDYPSLTWEDVQAAFDFEEWCRRRGRYDAPYAERLARRRSWRTTRLSDWPRVVWPRKVQA